MNFVKRNVIVNALWMLSSSAFLKKKNILEFDYLSNNLTEESVFSLTIAYSFSLTGKGKKRTEENGEFALNISIKQQFCFTRIFVQMSHKGSSLLSLTA